MVDFFGRTGAATPPQSAVCASALRPWRNGSPLVCALAALLCLAPNVHAAGDLTAAQALRAALPPSQSVQSPAVGQMEVAFSPSQGAQELVIRVIDSARQDIRVLAYSFTSAPVVQALIRARKRGVTVILVADQKSNMGADAEGESAGKAKARAALSALANAGASVYLISAFAIHHDKVILVDGKTVQTGSFNYSAAAHDRNSENVLVAWGNPQLAAAYRKHFERNLAKASPFRFDY